MGCPFILGLSQLISIALVSSFPNIVIARTDEAAASIGWLFRQKEKIACNLSRQVAGFVSIY